MSLSAMHIPGTILLVAHECSATATAPRTHGRRVYKHDRPALHIRNGHEGANRLCLPVPDSWTLPDLDELPLPALFAALVILLALSAFFSGSETALMTLNRYRMKRLADAGHRGARKARTLLERPDRLIGLILLGNNFVNILASSLATVIALRLGGQGAIAIAAGVLTFVVLIFSEVAPKTLAALHPETLAFPAAHVYSLLLKLTWPLVRVVNLLANQLLRLLGVSPDEIAEHGLDSEELRAAVHEAGALIPRRHQRMLLAVLDLEKVRVEDIMVPRNEIDGIDLAEPFDDIVQQLRDMPYTRVLVCEGGLDEIIGFVHARKLMQAAVAGELDKERIRALCRPPYYVPAATPLNQQLLEFQRTRRRIALAVDEYGDVLGLVTMADLLGEIVGEFATEPVPNDRDVQPQADGTWLVSGSANVRELVRAMHWELPTDGPKTLNGLILEQLEALPHVGTSLLLNGYPVDIVQTQGNIVKLARVHPRVRVNAPGSASSAHC